MNIDRHESFQRMIDESLAGTISVEKEQSLREHLATAVSRDAETRHLVVAHSHGGNVALDALGALATLHQQQLHLQASVCALDGSVSLDAADQAPLGAEPLAAAAALGVRLADQLLARGAADLIARQRT